MGDGRCLTRIVYRGRNAGLRVFAAMWSYFSANKPRAPHLTPFFFLLRLTFTHELLLIYFFVIWLDRQWDGGPRSRAAADGTGQQG
ncbi:hypothetical protein Bamb_4218 [Burkholderia ambifaria AMMD]|uniref:Uncharacterized protein n=1 Tax=Burkholderia ambifaria (strain ATCC BAA-244 / DSM 16087 / CCUG 44356 / LMG 19182 / AMMD) TaxID=339670 RepID=Q0B7V2_BURCM|nr:hypothetical protein Bamb_4218 [Burkholderia ambifaria AMMD]